jgi:hypothetical protein
MVNLVELGTQTWGRGRVYEFQFSRPKDAPYGEGSPPRKLKFVDPTPTPKTGKILRLPLLAAALNYRIAVFEASD